ncbi:LTR-retrotransposon skipper [Heterostelium album PN500]|uniref:LTR-retrotransposon skipper n=1 Tax=Heterostelium pallidum (strain ATCC 26659 / Pp 5 / PN500) TaxID=670386 RepID=D3BLL1_HETP5|nr:LTR-retrotransposon skipper [Heterostelium album PN500]EFA77462.1 LTR-retrotransposon skipper [Heterostelium album PN500]|eukprot:XP_020429590.1 LTR-retrotransposon skipper [Heterostelium album PN500]
MNSNMSNTYSINIPKLEIIIIINLYLFILNSEQKDIDFKRTEFTCENELALYHLPISPKRLDRILIPYKDFAELSAALVKVFGCKIDADSLYAKFSHQVVYDPKWSITSFNMSFNRLARIMNMGEAINVRMYKAAFINLGEIRTRLSEFTDLSQCLRKAEELFAFHYSAKNVNQSHLEKLDVADPCGWIDKHFPGFANKSVGQTTHHVSKPSFKCFNCGLPGHKSFECRKPRGPYHRDKRDRFRHSDRRSDSRSDRPKHSDRPSSGDKNPYINKMVGSVDTSSLPYVPIFVNGITKDAKLDTGSEINLLSRTVWNNLKLATPLTPACINICGVNGTPTRADGMVSLLVGFTTVKGHRVHIPMDFIIADVDPKVCIIGVDSLAKLDFRIVDNTLTISNNIVKTFRRGTTNHSALRNNIDFHVSGRKRKSALKCLFASTQKCDILHEITKICHQIHVTKEKLKTDFENFHFGNFNKFGYSPMTMATLNPSNPTNAGIEHINTADIADSYLVWIDPDDVKTPLPTATTLTANATATSADGLDGVREDIINMLKSDFQDVVSPMTSPPPFREDVDMKINLNAPVQKQRMFPVPQSLLEELHNQIKDLLHKGFIVPSNAEYGAPVLFVKKKTGNWRMCVDYRQLNKSTVKNSYPLPRINELLDRTKAAHWLSKLDLLHGYHQLRMNLQDADKTTFRCPFGSFKYTVIPFGLSNAPAVFQSFMDSVFKLEVFQKLLLVYLDDLLIMTNNSSITEHIDGIKHVFTILRKNNLHVNLSKCTFLVRSVDYLGHMVGNGKIDPLQDKIDSIIAWKEPNNKDELRSFLGLVNYYNRFIPRLATVQAPLTFLLRKFAPFHWSDDCQLAFDTIKSAIKEKPSLFPPNYDLPFIFECDASDVGTGYRLFQLVDGKENVICYGSKKLKDSETRYSTLEKELLAIVTALKANYYHIFGRDIEIRTDHKNITYINEANKIGINQTINRWIAHINLYQPKIKFIKGKDNTIADGLSRYTFNVSVSLSHPTIANDIIDGYRIEDNSNLSNRITDYTTINGLRYTHDGKIIVPRVMSIVNNLLYQAHDSEFGCHRSASKTLHSISELYVWPNMAADIRKYCDDCIVCRRASDHARKRIGHLIPLPIPVKCFQRINIDFIPNLPVEEYMGRKVDAIMVVVDALSKMTRLIPLGSDYTSKEVIDLFHKEIFKLHGIPIEIVSDNDSKLTSKLFKQLTKAYGIHHSTSAVSNQQANGQAERIIRAVKNATRKLMVDDRLHNTTGSWSKHIDTVEFSLNSTVHSTTEYTPFKIYLGHNPLTPLNLVKESDALVDVTDKQIIESIKERKAIIKLVKRNICIGNQEMRFTWNKGKKENQIKVGDYVFYNNNRDGKKKKLDVRYEGPRKVVEVDNYNNIFIDVIGKDGISTKKKKFNSKHIMLYDPKMNDNLINDVDDLLVENGATAETDRGSTVGDSSDDYDDSPRPIRRHTRRGLKNVESRVDINVERSVDKDDMEDNELNDDDDSDYDDNENNNNNNYNNNNNNDDMDVDDDDSDNLLINNNNNSNNSNNNNNNNNNNLNIDYFKFISNDSKFHQNITARGTLSNNLSKSILRNVENNFNELRNEVDKFDHNLKCNLNKSEIIATKNIISYINSDDFIPNTPSIIIADDVKVLAYTKWRKDIVAILAKRKFTLGTSKLARVEYLVKVGRALAWVPLPGNTLATKFSSAHSVPDSTDG